MYVDSCSIDILVESFSDFLSTRLWPLRHPLGLITVEMQQPPPQPSPLVRAPMDILHPATEHEIQCIIAASPNKQCALDPFPTGLVKSCKDFLTPIIMQIVNKSLSTGEFPQVFKNALVTPLLKKRTLDEDVLNNYRPVSNLAFISKITEKVVASRLNHHLMVNNLQEPFQSAYRMNHSTETAMLRVQNDIIRALGDNKVVLLVLIDLSAAFDTVNHKRLLNTLHAIGITGKALGWFTSYLQNRSQTITISGKQSRSRQLECGVPQGSVLGPILFNVYTAALGLLLRQEKTNYSMYADDTDLYLIFKPSELTENVAEMERTAGLVRRWMAANELKMNDAKTEVMLITPRRMATKIECPTLVIGDHAVATSPFVRNLGIILDSVAAMERQINAVCKTSHMHLYNISKIRCYLDKQSLACVIHAFVTCRLDYGNALLCGYPGTQIQKLQRVQNVAARLISGRRKYDHITPVLKNLHWLPVGQRIKFKVMITVFKAMHNTAPAYLQELIVPYVPSRGLRSQEHNLLCVPFTRSTMAGSRAFRIAGPTLWNALPQYLRDISDIAKFKRQLKTHLFAQHYGQ